MDEEIKKTEEQEMEEELEEQEMEEEEFDNPSSKPYFRFCKTFEERSQYQKYLWRCNPKLKFKTYDGKFLPAYHLDYVAFVLLGNLVYYICWYNDKEEVYFFTSLEKPMVRIDEDFVIKSLKAFYKNENTMLGNYVIGFRYPKIFDITEKVWTKDLVK